MTDLDIYLQRHYLHYRITEILWTTTIRANFLAFWKCKLKRSVWPEWRTCM